MFAGGLAADSAGGTLGTLASSIGTLELTDRETVPPSDWKATGSPPFTPATSRAPYATNSATRQEALGENPPEVRAG
jgi:hypothetical protein